MNYYNLMSGTALAVMAATGVIAEDAPQLDVIHWLTAGAEQASVQILADAVEAHGAVWVDSAAPGGGTDAQAMLMSRIAGGNPPGAAFLALGPEATELGEAGALRNVLDIAQANGLDAVVPVMIEISTTADGALYALPIGLETQNLMFFSPAAYAAAGVPVPKTWQEVIDTAPAMNEKGIIPIAVGAQGWQLGILFTSIIVGLGDANLYNAVFEEKNADAATGPEMIAVFATLRSLSDIADQGAANRAWNDTLNLVASGEAAFQIMGSWAGAELENMNLEQGAAWDCTLAPGNHAAVVEGAGFMFPEPTSDSMRAAQDIFVSVLLDPKVQADFGQIKGAVPPSKTADTSGMSSCIQMVATTLASGEGTGLPTISATVSADGWGQIQDLLANYWADRTMTPEAGAAQLATILATQH